MQVFYAYSNTLSIICRIEEAIALKPEEEARKKIDALLEKAGWLIQDYKDLNLGAGSGVAVREFPLKGAGFAESS